MMMVPMPPRHARAIVKMGDLWCMRHQVRWRRSPLTRKPVVLAFLLLGHAFASLHAVVTDGIVTCPGLRVEHRGHAAEDATGKVMATVSQRPGRAAKRLRENHRDQRNG